MVIDMFVKNCPHNPNDNLFGLLLLNWRDNFDCLGRSIKSVNMGIEIDYVFVFNINDIESPMSSGC